MAAIDTALFLGICVMLLNHVVTQHARRQRIKFHAFTDEPSSPRPTPWRRLVTAMDALGDNS